MPSKSAEEIGHALPERSDSIATEREGTSFIGDTVDEVATGLALDPSTVPGYADMVARSDHKRRPPLTPNDPASLFEAGGD